MLLVFGHEVRLTGADSALGAALVFGSALSYAVYLVYSGREVRRLGALRLTGWATSVACVLCIAQFLLLRPLSAPAVAPAVIWLSLLNATLCTFAPVLMVMMAIERIGATLTAQTGMIGPVSTIVMGVLILGEPFNAWIVAGTALVLLGVWLLAPRTLNTSQGDNRTWISASKAGGRWCARRARVWARAARRRWRREGVNVVDHRARRRGAAGHGRRTARR